MEMIGYIAAIFVGIALGLVGSGGFLALPILVYLFHVEDANTATAYSLFLVGLVSLMGVFLKNKQGLVNYKTALLFGIPTILSIFITRKFLMPAIPNELLSINGILITKKMMVMVLLALTMMFSAYFMIKKRSTEADISLNKNNGVINFIGGILIGVLTGFVGIGGGFVIVPALIKIADLPMKNAVGTSLLIVTLNSAFGFAGSLSNLIIDWNLIILFSVFALSGMLAGNLLSKKINGANLKVAFGWFVMVAGILIIINELKF